MDVQFQNLPRIPLSSFVFTLLLILIILVIPLLNHAITSEYFSLTITYF